MGRQHQEQWPKINTDRKRSSYTEKDRSPPPKNHSTTAVQVTAELNIRLEDSVSTKNVRCEIHISNIHGTAAIAELLITENNAQMCK
jgi:hypothetical protein